VGIGATIAVTGATAKSSANIKVCVLLPDTKSSVRWVQFDAPYFAKALKKAKVTYSITNALNDPQKMVSQADSCLSRGAKVAIVTDIAQGTSIAIEKKFAKAGGYSIDYDRQVVGGVAKVYVSFDSKTTIPRAVNSPSVWSGRIKLRSASGVREKACSTWSSI
jgi:D-xylose transport system substrate-binding protein